MNSGESSNAARLLSHRDSFRGSLVPMTGPLLRYEELNRAERALLQEDFVARRRQSDLPDHSLFLDVMHSWGIICTHPQASRTYEKLYWSDAPVPFSESRWFVCDVCDCIVINRGPDA